MRGTDRPTPRAKSAALGTALALAALLLLAPAASAIEPPEELTRLGGEDGSAAGQLSVPSQSAADPVTGHIYISDYSNNRIDEFTPWGAFVKAFGGNVAPGAVNEAQEVRVSAGAGTFKLTFGADTTSDLPFDATAEQVQSALEALASIGGGQVSVSAALGNAATSTPFVYVIVFKGSLAGTDVAQITAVNGATPLSAGNPTTSLESRTRADGVGAAHAGLESCTAESGCQAGVVGIRAGQLKPFGVAVGPKGDIFISDNGPENPGNPRIQEFDPAGRFLRTWGGDVITDGAAGTGVVSPGSAIVTSVATTEKVFREGQAIEGTGIEAGTTIESVGANTIILSQPGGPAATGAPTPISAPQGTGNTPVNEKQTVTLGSNTTGGSFNLKFKTPDPSPSAATTAAIAANATALQVEEKLAALANVGAPNVTVSGPAGGPWTVEFKGTSYAGSDVEALEPTNTGNLTVSTGEKKATVVAANSGEVCEVAPQCQRGALGTAQGQFNGPPLIAISPAGKILAGDYREAGLISDSRIQRFSTSGGFEMEVGIPSGQIRSLAVSPASGKLYVAYGESQGGGFQYKEDVRILDPMSGAETGSLAVSRPEALATDTAGNLYVAAGQTPGIPARVQHITEFAPDGNQLLPNQAEEESCIVPEEESVGQCQFFNRILSTADSYQGLGTGPAGNLFVSFRLESAHESYVGVYGPPPVQFEPPPSAAPSIEAQYAISVDSGSAELGARINPHFWVDTTYYLEYGTAPCSEGGCVSKPVPPGSTLTKKVINAEAPSAPVVLEGLTPGTTYHYRFVAASSGGGPVRGKGGTEAADGTEATFTTARGVGSAQGCQNEAFRIGASAALPDCRAYEMVSPVDKEGADVLVVRPELFSQALQQASTSGGRLVFPSRRSFGEDPSAPYTSQFLAARGAGGWSTHSINPFQGRYVIDGLIRFNSEFFAFSPDLCEAWMESAADPPLSPGAPLGYRDLYHRTDEQCGGPGYEAMNTLVPPSWSPYPSLGGFEMGFEGASADGLTAIFIANDKLAPDGAEKVTQLYAHTAGNTALRLVCVLPSGKALDGFCSAGENLAHFNRGFENGKVPGALQGAISADGSRVFWTAGAGAGQIYVRENPMQSQSALAHGGATGTGRLTAGSETITSLVAARGKADLTAGTAQIALSEATIGQFVAGQPITGTGIPAATTVLSVEGSTLTLSNAIEAGKTASGVTVSSGGPMPFEIGQSIAAPGIPNGTTIAAVAPGSLILSAKATVTKAGVALSATSECSEADKACTLPVSQQAESESGVGGSEFRAAAADGSKAIFLNGRGLYEFTVAGQTTEKIAGRVLGVMGASKDARRIYFASEEALAPGGVADEPNLYLYETGAGGGFAFVASLTDQDVSGVGPDGSFATPFNYDLDGGNFPHTARVSPDGLHAAFLSFGTPTGYDNTDLSSAQADGEVYVYDASANSGAGQLRCASCNPSGARPHGQLVKKSESRVPLAAEIPGLQSSVYGTRVLADDGSRLYFESYDALVPRDTNGALDVYQWEVPGAGGCEESNPDYSPANGGCIDLISTGRSPVDASFVDATPSGSDVFFTTDESLLPQDVGLRDIYDARIGGGFPPPPTPPAPCEGEACQPPSAAPNDQTPSSASFHGSGNLGEGAKPRCRKGARQVRQKGRLRCVKTQRAKKHRRHRTRAADRNLGGAR